MRSIFALILLCCSALTQAFTSQSAQQAHSLTQSPRQQAYLYNPAILGLSPNFAYRSSWQASFGYKDFGLMNERFAEFREDGLYDFLYLLNYTGEELQEPFAQSISALFAVQDGTIDRLAKDLTELINQYEIADGLNLETILQLLDDDDFDALLEELSDLITDINVNTQSGLLALLQEFERMNYATAGAIERLPLIQDIPFELQQHNSISWAAEQGQWSWQQSSQSYGMMRFQKSDFDSVKTLFADYYALNGFIFELAELGSRADKHTSDAQQSVHQANLALKEDPNCSSAQCKELTDQAVTDLWELFVQLGVDLDNPNQLGLISDIDKIWRELCDYSSVDQGGFLDKCQFDIDALESSLPGRGPDHITGLALLVHHSQSLGYSRAWQGNNPNLHFGATAKLDAHLMFNHTVYSLEKLPEELIPQSRLLLRPNLDLGVIWQAYRQSDAELRFGLTAINAIPWRLNSAPSKAFASEFWLLPRVEAGAYAQRGPWQAHLQSELYQRRPHSELPSQQWIKTGLLWQHANGELNLGTNLAYNLADDQPARLGLIIGNQGTQSDLSLNLYGQLSSQWSRDLGGQINWNRKF